MEDIKGLGERLDNIESVRPIVGSLHTIATGGWRVALSRMRASSRYVEILEDVLAVLLPRVPSRALERAHVSLQAVESQRPLLLVLASEGGLCGAFNELVLSGAEKMINERRVEVEEVRIATFGRRAEVYLRSRGYELFAAYPSSIAAVPSFQKVQKIGKGILRSFEEGTIDAIEVIYSPYRTGMTTEPVARRWLPLERSALPTTTAEWPPAIIETDGQALFQRAMREWVFCRLYQTFMESAASEQSARFRAMDNAQDNLERMIEELTQRYHAARQHAITMEMLDLIAGSGLLQGAG
ncbi:MAG: FoF1 ATP synthase subunit gamma [Chloroflexota bacterium]|nr:FoF1 ATP synthase subunit gamma [Chloroflexota bacterium]